MNDEVRFERQGATGTIWLDRPKALNALTHAMVRAMDATLADWGADPAIARVIIRSTSEKAFCAGGDVRAVRALGPGPHPDQVAFFSDEYRLNARIKHFPKPFIALIDGICMGGGVGISAHGSHRVATEKFVFAMPEVAIGFFPDVGGGHVLSRMPGRAGLYCGLTGGRLGLADGLWAVETEGALRGTSKHFFRVPVGAEMCGPYFTPDDETLFLAVQHPGTEGDSTFEKPSTRWPDFKKGMPPRPSVLAVTKNGGGKIGGKVA